MPDEARSQLYELCDAVQDFIKEQAQKGRYFAVRINHESAELQEMLVPAKKHHSSDKSP